MPDIDEPDIDQELGAAFADLVACYGGETTIPPATLRALRRRPRSGFGPALAVAASVAAVLLVVVAVTVTAVGTRHRRSAATPAPVTSSPPPILQPGQFVGLIDPGAKDRTQQYAWILGPDGRPIKRLARAVGVIGVAADRRQALIELYPTGSGGPSGPSCEVAPATATALVSLADGSLSRPFPAQPDVQAGVLSGSLVAGIDAPPPAPQQKCPAPSLLVRDLGNGGTREYRLSSRQGLQNSVVALSPDGTWAVISALLINPVRQRFYLASLADGQATLAPLPSQPGCTQSSFTPFPGTNDLTVAAACARTITITTYDPETLAVIHTTRIPDPPGATVTFVGLIWNADGTQALITGVHDNSDTGPITYLWRDGRLTRLTTPAYGIAW